MTLINSRVRIAGVLKSLAGGGGGGRGEGGGGGCKDRQTDSLASVRPVDKLSIVSVWGEGDVQRLEPAC